MNHVDLAMTTLLNGLWEGAFLAVAMWFFLKLLSRLNPATRFGLLWVALLAVVALLLGPFMRGAFPAGASTDSRALAATNKPALAATSPFSIGKTESSYGTPQSASEPQPASVAKSDPQFPPEQAPPLVEPRVSASPIRWAAITTVDHPLIHIHSGRLLAGFELAWALLSVVMLGRLEFAYWKLQRLKASATPLSAKWQSRLKSLCGINGVHRPTRLLVSKQITTPMSLGFLHPAILIPQTLADSLSYAELEHVILHELGHLQRRDDWTNLAQKLIEAMLPIQPAVYWIGQRMSIEREMACDDWVVAATGTAESYASSLARVAELSRWTHASVLAAGATGNRSQLFSRVHHMLDKTRDAAPRLTIAPLGTAIAAAAVLIYAGVRAPQLIALAQISTSESSRHELVPLTAPQESKTPQTSTAPIPAPLPSASPAMIAALQPAAPLPAPAASAVSVAPASPIEAAEPQQRGESHTEITTQNGFTSLKVKIDGAVEFTDDDRDVKSLSPGGRFRIEEGSWLSGRVYEVKADSGGNLSRTYSVGTSVKPLDAEGQEWLGKLLPQVIRDTGVGVGPRVARILRQGGPPAVINEIGLIHSDGSKRIYIEQLFTQATLNAEQLQQAAKLIQGISSDGDKAQVLIDVDGKYFTGELRQYLFDAAQSISSDGDKRRVISDIVTKDAGSEETLLDATRMAKHISSDGDKAAVLIEIAGPYRENGGLGIAYFDAAKSVSSDGDHARVLLAMLSAHGDDHETLVRILRSAASISSDGDKARVLKEAAARYSGEEPISKAFIDAANSISSDGDHQQVLVTLVHRQGMSAATVGEIAKSAQRISSDGDKARVLVELVGVNVEPARGDFFAATDSINSDGDHSRVLLAVLDKPGASSGMAIAAIQSATRISSDGDKARVLKEAAQRYSADPQVNAALRKAVESLHSDGEYRSVMSELARRDSSN